MLPIRYPTDAGFQASGIAPSASTDRLTAHQKTAVVRCRDGDAPEGQTVQPGPMACFRARVPPRRLLPSLSFERESIVGAEASQGGNLANVPDVSRLWRGGGGVPLDWSPDGDWILYARGSTLLLVSADGSRERQLFSARLPLGSAAAGFSRDGRQVLILQRNIDASGAAWLLRAIDVASGAIRVLADIDLPATTGNVAGFSLHPDGTRFLTSASSWPYDIWMLEGFDGSTPATAAR
jgi:hypothetical protein